jgi:mxaA protein
LIASTLVLASALLGAPRANAASPTPSLGHPNTMIAPNGASPRRFGYVLGDMIERRAQVSAPAGFTLEPASLPKLGTQNAWLALIQASVRDQGGTPLRYEIDLRYQLINAPTEVRTLALPGFHVRFTPVQEFPASARPEANPEAGIEEQPVRIAPILPAHVPFSASLLRPDRPPRALSSTPELLAAGLSAVLATGLVAALIAQPALRRRRGPFARAHRRIRRAVFRAELMRADTEGVYPAALRAVHRAFDQTAGWSLFPDRLGEFLTQRRQFADLRSAIERFLDMSEREFFECRLPAGAREGSQRERGDLRWLLEFTHECRARERQAA